MNKKNAPNLNTSKEQPKDQNPKENEGVVVNSNLNLNSNEEMGGIGYEIFTIGNPSTK